MISQWRVLHMSKFGEVRDKIDAQEPFVDRWLTRLAAHPHTAQIVVVVTALALAAGLLLWLW